MRNISYGELLDNIGCGLVIFLEDDFTIPPTFNLSLVLYRSVRLNNVFFGKLYDALQQIDITFADDLKKFLYKEIVGVLISPFLILLILMLLYVLLKAVSLSTTVLYYLLVLSLLIVFGYLVYILALLIQVKQHKFKVTTAQVINTQEGCKGYGKWGTYKPYTIYFSGQTKFDIPEGNNYKWSKLYCMTAKSVYNSTNIGDNFCVAILNKRIFAAYNMKLFEFKE